MHPKAAYERVRFAEFEVDLGSRELFYEGRKLPLQEQPFQVLRILLERPGQLVTREELRSQLWAADTFVDFDHSLNKAVAKLREALGHAGGQSPLIETLPRRGYRFIAPVEWMNGNHSAAAESLPAVSQSGSHQRTDARWMFRFPGRAILLSLAVIALLLGLGSTGYIFRRSAPRPSMTTVPLTSLPGAETEAAFSSDGEQVAFVWDGDSGNRTDVYVKRIGTERALQLSQSSGFVCCDVWSSDDRYIAFQRCSGENQGIFLVPSLGGPERKLRKTIGCAGLGWSPTDPVLVFGDKNSPETPYALFLMSAEDLQPHQLTFPLGNVVGDQDPVFSPDGKSIAFIRVIGEGATDIFTVAVSGGPARQLTFDKSGVFGLTWSAGGKKIIFSSHRDGGLSLWAVSLAGGEPERLPLGGAAATGPTISRKGGRLAYTQGLIRPNLWSIALSQNGRKVSGGPSQFLFSAAYNNGPQFSPDGKRLAFTSERSGYNEIWTCDATDCSEPQQLTFLKVVSGMPRWSPDSKQIVFDSRPTGHSQVMMISAEGGSPVPLTDGKSEDKVPSWSSDGKFVYFSSNRSDAAQIWKVPATGGQSSRVTRHGGFAAFESSDGRYLYYAKDNEPGIWRMPTGGGDETRILADLSPECWGDWALSKSGVYYVSEAGPRPAIEFFDFASKRVSRVAELAGLPPQGDPGFAVSPDGTRIIFSQVDTSAVDIMLVENFPFN
jgi:Tol biopolymer transport system component/DNA-binding winged helix-turn-helix (wHTH) protein